MKCHMEYEDGTPFCNNCGGDLVPKKEPEPKQEDKKKAEGAKPDGRLVCPKCHILYEKMTSCIRCGVPLVTQSELKKMKESPPPPGPETKKAESKATQPSEVKREPSPVPPPKRPTVEGKKEEPKRTSTPEIKKERPAKEIPEDQIQGTLPPKKEKQGFFRSLHGILFIIFLLMVGAYFLINYSGKEERSRRETPSSKKIVAPPDKEDLPVSKQPSPTIPSSALPVVLLPQEIQKILDLLENVRLANLRKDINLFMSCYSSDFKDPEERRRTALESWSRYNYLDLVYIFKPESVLIDSAKGRVEWRIRSIPVKGGQPEEGKSVLNVTFQKEKNEWKIKEVAPIK
jgi:hypothetical protein